MAFITVTRALFASVVTGMGAALCCVGPAVLWALGLGSGTGALSPTAAAPYRPLLIGVAVLSLGLAFSRVYLLPAYAVNGSRAEQCALNRQRHWFWWTASMVASLVAIPWLALLWR